MTRFSLLLASLTVGLTTSASALVGGPFDNGDYSSLLDNSGVYQVAMRFPNGSGFAQFGTNVDITTYVDISSTGAGAGNSVRGTTFSVLNRSLIYYKGVTYLGTASGMVDHQSKRISGMTNGNSDVRTSQVQQTGGGGSAAAAATSTLLNNSSLSFPCNTNFLAKITSTSPVLRFHGSGELTVINPSLAQVAYSAFVALLTTQQSSGTGNQTLGAQITAIANAVTSITNTANVIPSTDQVESVSDSVKMTVFGSRVFFVGRR